ncbi:MAG: sigma factor [Candidatus Brocadiia bacterium]
MDRCDEKLVRRALDGDTAAFATLVERYRDAAYGMGLHVLGDPHEAADAAQEALIRAWRALDQLRDPGKFCAWLCRIAANTARPVRRRKRSRNPRRTRQGRACGLAQAAIAGKPRWWRRCYPHGGRDL